MKLENVVGIIAGLIPGVSTISGIIKFFIYYNKANKTNTDKTNHEAVQETAQKVQDTAKVKIDVKLEKKQCYEKLWKAAIAEAIPGINIIAAIYSAAVLMDLSDLKEINKNTEMANNYFKNKYDLGNTSQDLTAPPLVLINNLNLPDKLKRCVFATASGALLNPEAQKASTEKVVRWAVQTLLNDYKESLQEYETSLVSMQSRISELEDDIKKHPEIIREIMIDEIPSKMRSPIDEFQRANELQQLKLRVEAFPHSIELKESIELLTNLDIMKQV